MHTIVALGNPGQEYENTRHNAGRIALVAALRSAGWPILSPSGKTSVGKFGGEDVRVLIPDTYMNVSGEAVAKVIGRDAADELIVVYDDVDLPIGEIKVSYGRGAGGHNGVSSVIAAMGTKDFARVRVGIARRNFWGKVVRPSADKLADFVLGHLSKGEINTLENLKETISGAIVSIIKDGASVAMNKYN